MSVCKYVLCTLSKSRKRFPNTVFDLISPGTENVIDTFYVVRVHFLLSTWLDSADRWSSIDQNV